MKKHKGTLITYLVMIAIFTIGIKVYPYNDVLGLAIMAYSLEFLVIYSLGIIMYCVGKIVPSLRGLSKWVYITVLNTLVLLASICIAWLKRNTDTDLAVFVPIMVLPISVLLYIMALVAYKLKQVTFVRNTDNKYIKLIRRLKLKHFMAIVAIIVIAVTIKPVYKSIRVSIMPEYNIQGVWYQANPDTPSTQVYTIYEFKSNSECYIHDSIGFMGDTGKYETDGKTYITIYWDKGSYTTIEIYSINRDGTITINGKGEKFKWEKRK